jgi:hypothetical protein
MMTAVRTYLKILFQVPMKDELAASRAFPPQIVGDLTLSADKFAKLRPNDL